MWKYLCFVRKFQLKKWIKGKLALVMVTHEQDVGEEADRIVTVLDDKVKEGNFVPE